jgi:hypothetical protein
MRRSLGAHAKSTHFVNYPDLGIGRLRMLSVAHIEGDHSNSLSVRKTDHC